MGNFLAAVAVVGATLAAAPAGAEGPAPFAKLDTRLAQRLGVSTRLMYEAVVVADAKARAQVLSRIRKLGPNAPEDLLYAPARKEFHERCVGDRTQWKACEEDKAKLDRFEAESAALLEAPVSPTNVERKIHMAAMLFQAAVGRELPRGPKDDPKWRQLAQAWAELVRIAQARAEGGEPPAELVRRVAGLVGAEVPKGAGE